MVSPEYQATETEDNTDCDGAQEEFEDTTERRNASGDWGRVAWTLCAAASIVTSKYILVDCNYHYPFHLVLMQVFAIAAVALFGRAVGLEHIVSTSIIKENRDWGWIATVDCLEVLSLAFWMQAVLHFPNLATLGMLPLLAALVELVISNVYYGQFRDESLRLLTLAISCCALFYGEYRLTPNGLIFAIPASICTGAAKSMRRVLQATSLRPILTAADIGFYICWLVLMQAMFTESTLSALANLRLAIAPTLALNIVSSTSAILLSRSGIIPPFRPKNAKIPDSKNIYSLEDIASFLTLAGLTGLSSVLMLRRSYTSLLQFVAFFMAIICLYNNSLSGLTRCYHGWRNGGALLVEGMQDEAVYNNSYRSRKSVSRVHLILALSILGLWMAFIAKNFNDRSTPAPDLPLSLDLTYTPHTDMEIVISVYDEPLDTVNYLISSLKAFTSLSSATVHIYTKDESADLEAIQQNTGANKITQLANVGREGETYLRHIIGNWDSLATHTLFIQGDIHNPREVFPRIRDYFDPQSTGMLSLGFSGNVCDCKRCGDRWGWSDSIVYSIFEDIYPSGTCSELLLSYKGQFIASARRIRGVRKEVYEKLLDALDDENSWAHREDYLKGREDSLNAPFFGFTLERLWNVLMRCSDMDIAWKCPTLLSGTRSGGSKGDCQCFDDVGR